ncbi:MAG: hypothetical protein JO202_02860 [Ktedonobacteraceae bacterium]|nr:hypothetical protein [Ktedonobacteraceae bacterium]
MGVIPTPHARAQVLIRALLGELCHETLPVYVVHDFACPVRQSSMHLFTKYPQ